MMNNDEQQVIALAATVQALSVVHEIATRGQFVEHRAAAVLKALTVYSPEDTLSAYGGNIHDLSHGLSQLEHMLTDKLDRDIAQYLLAVVTIELKLVRQPRMRNILQTEIQRMATAASNIEPAQDTVDHFSDNFDDEEDESTDDRIEDAANTIAVLTSADMISQFAEVYKKTASQTEPRIMVKGSHEYLQNEHSANQIRALLFAALRSAAFFRQYGGKRVDFMMKRKQYLHIAQQLKSHNQVH